MSIQLQPSASRLIGNLCKKDIAMKKTEFITHVISTVTSSDDKNLIIFEVLTDRSDTRLVITKEKCLDMVSLVLESSLRAEARRLINLGQEKVVDR